jgi:hypothetical protein
MGGAPIAPLSIFFFQEEEKGANKTPRQKGRKQQQHLSPPSNHLPTQQMGLILLPPLLHLFLSIGPVSISSLPSFIHSSVLLGQMFPWGILQAPNECMAAGSEGVRLMCQG